MTGSSSGVARRRLAWAPVLALAGCASLFVATPPGHLYRLSTDTAYPSSCPM